MCECAIAQPEHGAGVGSKRWEEGVELTIIQGPGFWTFARVFTFERVTAAES